MLTKELKKMYTVNNICFFLNNKIYSFKVKSELF